MLGHERTKRHRIIEYMGYIFLALFVVGGTVALVFYARGYYYNPRSGQIVSNGLVLVASEPVEADVYLDGAATGKQTQWRSTLPVGEHTIALRREGYREWRRTFDLETGEVLWLSYPLLLPQNLSSREVIRLENRTIVSPSLDNSLIAVATGQKITLIRSDTPLESQINVDVAAQLPGIPGRIRDAVWSSGANRLLLAIDDGKKRTHVLLQIGRNGASVQSVRERLANYTDIRFVPGSIGQVYALRDKQLWRVNISNDRAPQRVAEQVDLYEIDGEELVTWEAESQRIIFHRGDKSLALNVEPVSDLNSLALGRQDGQAVIALSSASGGITIIHRPGETNEKIIHSSFRAQNLIMSIGANYLAAFSGKDFQVYDIERSRFHNFSLPTKEATNVRWATGAHLSAVADGQAVLLDFTGDNLQRLGAAVAGPVVLSTKQSHALHRALSGVDKHPMLVDTTLAPSN